MSCPSLNLHEDAVNSHRQTRPKRIKDIYSFREDLFLNILSGSIERRHPPEPDILCKINGQGLTAFEMVELIDTDLATRTPRGIEVEVFIDEGVEKLSSKEKGEIKRRLGNALVHVAFNPQASFRTRRDVIPEILTSVRRINPTFVGNFLLNPKLGSVACVKRITIRRGSFVGPCFDVEAAGFFADPTVEKFKRNFRKPTRPQTQLSF